MMIFQPLNFVFQHRDKANSYEIESNMFLNDDLFSFILEPGSESDTDKIMNEAEKGVVFDQLLTMTIIDLWFQSL